MMHTSLPRRWSSLMIFAVAVFLVVTAPAQAQTPVSVDKTFIPATIGPGSVATVQFTISNGSSSPLTGLAFTDVLPTVPGNIVIADPANASTNCAIASGGAGVAAPDGGGTITFGDGLLGASESCTITVDVTGNTAGVHTNPAIALVYNELSGDPPTSSPIDLTVDTSLPGFSKNFAPSTVPLGARSTLTLTIDNTANESNVLNLDFTDNLPGGMLIAGPANASTTCGTATIPPVLTAVAGTSLIILDSNGAFAFPALAAGATCTVTVDVVATGAGILDNVTGDLLADFVNVGKASASLDVTSTPLALVKAFTDDPVPPGDTTTLEFRIYNFDRVSSATGVGFTDDLAAALSGLTFSSLLANDCGGTVMGVGTTTITFAGGTLAPASFCTIRTSLSVPPAAMPGAYTNTTGAVTATVGGSPVTGNVATDVLFVEPAPVLTKLFVGDPINPGDSVTLRFTVNNTSATSGATNISFIDELTDPSGSGSGTTGGFLPFPVSVTLPPVPDPPCGAGSSLALISVGFDRQGLSLTGGSLAAAGMAGDSCTFEVTLTVPLGQAPGVYMNTTGVITATVDGATRVGDPASDDLTVIAAPQLSKAFTDDPVAPGGTVTLEFSLTYPPDASGDATDIAFTDDLASVLTGLTAVLPSTPDPPCGAGSSLTGSAGDTFLTLAGGTLSPGSSCTFSVTLNVPAGAAYGTYPNTTSGVSATVQSTATTSAPASDVLNLAGLSFSKEFTDDPALPGGTVTLEFTIENVSPTDDATGITFSDDLAAILPGTPDITVVSALPMNVCNGTLAGIGPSFLSFTGGSLMAGDPPCTFSVTLNVPLGAADGTYANVTNNLFATMGGSGVMINPAVDDLAVNANLLQLTKEFTDDPVAPGDTATLEFTIDNSDAVNAVTGISFTDDLGAALAGLAAVGLPQNDVCGVGSQITGAGVLALTGGNLPAGGSCTFSVTVQVPGAASAGSYTNVTSQVSGDIGGLGVTGDPAADDLRVSSFTFSKAFGGPVPAGGTTALTFTIENLDASAGAVGFSFTDDLDAVVPGMVAVGLPAADVCGPGSVLAGTSILSLTGGNLGPGGSCMFSVDVQVPAAATPGTYVNTTSSLSLGGIPSAEPAEADIVVEAAAAPTAIPVTTPIGALALIALISGAALWLLRWRG